MKSRNDPEYDKLYKVRPLLDCLSNYMKTLEPEEYQAVDEQIIPFKGRNHLKQYVKNKPHKWGYKVFMRAGSSGLMYDFRIYEGRGTCEEVGLGFSGDIVMALCQTIPEGKNFKIFFDNWFSSLQLSIALKEKGILSLGTIRKDRMGKCPLQDENEMKKSGRGSKDWRVETSKDIALVRWFDRKAIHFISSYACIDPEGKCQRWSTADKKKVDVPQPFVVAEYNRFMGGVDKADMLLELYRIDIRSNKWYMRIVFWVIGVAVVNSWLQYKRNETLLLRKPPYTLLQFQASVSTAFTKSGKTDKRKRGRPSSDSPVGPKKKKKSQGAPRPIADVRFDNIGHLPAFDEKQGRCKNCPKGFAHIKCTKCQVNLCLTKNKNCFMDFHKKN